MEDTARKLFHTQQGPERKGGPPKPLSEVCTAWGGGDNGNTNFFPALARSQTAASSSVAGCGASAGQSTHVHLLSRVLRSCVRRPAPTLGPPLLAYVHVCAESTSSDGLTFPLVCVVGRGEHLLHPASAVISMRR